MRNKYQRIAHDLRSEIEAGTYPPGSALPPIPELMETYDVSRETVRSAVAALAHEGLVSPQSGVGTIVRDLTRVDLVSRPGSAHPAWEQTSGEEATTVNVAAGRVKAPREIAERLKIDVGSVVVRRYRHYKKGRDVVLIHEQWIPSKLADTIRKKTKYNPADKDAEQTSDLYSLMRESGHDPVSTTEVVTARMPDPDERETMNMAAGIPVLITMRITVDAEGTPLETSDFAGVGDRSSQTYTVPIGG